MIIRLMDQKDLIKVVAIEEKVQFHPWAYTQFMDSLNSYQCTVLEEGANVIGFCIMQPVLDEANLLLMAVDPTQQGKGFGYQLLADATERLGSSCVQVFLEVRESNQAAISLYEKSGFHQIDMRKNYYPLPQGKKEHAVIMVKMTNEAYFDFKS